MILGVIAPALVLYHCNFQLGSLNSRVALFSTLVVAISGLVGRYLYAKIHVGLYGRRKNLEQLVERTRASAKQRTFSSAFVPALLERMSRIDEKVLKPPDGLLASTVLPFSFMLKTRWARFTLTRFARQQIRAQAEKSTRVAAERQQIEGVISKFIAEHLKRVRRVATFHLFERLFSLWHVFNLPFFFILVLAVIAHVVAVHMY